MSCRSPVCVALRCGLTTPGVRFGSITLLVSARGPVGGGLASVEEGHESFGQVAAVGDLPPVVYFVPLYMMRGGAGFGRSDENRRGRCAS